MDSYLTLLLLLSSYLIGSIPSSVWIGKGFYNIDVRQFGSGNAGATNTFRTLGPRAGIPVLLLDVIKGWAAVKLVLFTNFAPDSIQFINFEILLGIPAVLGHLFPIYAKFKGGKGVATILGIMFAIFPTPTLVCLGIFVLSLLVSKYVSLSSIISGVIFPILVIFVFQTPFLTLRVFSVIVAIVLLFTHKKNITRLVNKTENKINFSKSKDGDEDQSFE